LEKEGTHVLLVCTDDDGTLKVRSTGELSIAIVEEDGKTKVDVVNKATGTVVNLDEENYIKWITDGEDLRPTECEVNPNSLELTVGDTKQLSATVIPIQCIQSVIWSSSDEEVVTVDDKGLVTAVGVGFALISARPNARLSGSYSKNICQVTINAKTVQAVPITSISDPDNYSNGGSNPF
jgi:uncharacterized protein YjdB